MRLRVQGLSVDLGADWELRAPWDDAASRELLGAYVLHRGTGRYLHVRGADAGTQADLERMLLAQQWAGPPHDRVVRRVRAMVIVGGTFPYPQGGRVREWFLSDGRHGANASLLLEPTTPVAAIEAAEALLDSVAWQL